MKAKSFLASIGILLCLLPAAAEAATNKIVLISGDAAYSATYVYQGTRNTYPYYKHQTQDYYLYVDNYLGSWTLWVIGALVSNPDAGDVKYYQYPLSGNPGDPDWYEALPNIPATVSITDEASGNTPTVTTSEASLVTTTSATMGGNIVSDGGATTSRGIVYSSTDTTPTIGEGGVTQLASGTGVGTFAETVGALTAGATYYFQAYGTNSYGTAYGGVKSFSTPATSEPNKYLSGITGPAAANGVYIWIGNYYGKPAWKHQTENYWIYYSVYNIVPPWDTQYNWYIDDELKNNHGSNDYFFWHADAATCPASGWTVGAGSGVGTPAIMDYPQIAFTSGAAFSPGDPAGGTNNNPIGRFYLAADAAGAALTAATINLGGARSGVANLKLWSSTDATFTAGGDTQLNSQADGATVVFSGFSSSISTAGTFYFITADLNPNATGSCAAAIGSQADLTITGGAIASGFSNAALTSGTLSIIPATPTQSPTPSASATITGTFSPTLTLTVTPTPTHTPTTTSTATPTQSPTTTLSPTSTCTPSITPTSTISPTATLSPVCSPTATPTLIPSTSPTSTATFVLTPPGGYAADNRRILAYPQPGLDRMTFLIKTTQGGGIIIRLFNLSGELIARLDSQAEAGETAAVLWDCGKIAPGVYLAIVEQNGQALGKCKVAIGR